MRVGPAQLWPDVAPQWILNLPEGLEEFCFDVYKSFIFDDRYEMYVRGLGNTLLLTLMATIMGTHLLNTSLRMRIPPYSDWLLNISLTSRVLP